MPNQLTLRIVIFLGWVLISIIQFVGRPANLFFQETSTTTSTVQSSETNTLTPSVAPSVTRTTTNTATITHTPTTTHTQAVISTTSTPIPSTTQTPTIQWTATPIIVPTETPSGSANTQVPSGLTATLAPFPSITYVLASTQESQNLLIVERNPESRTRVQYYVNYIWHRFLTLWPLMVLAVLWIAIAAWFVLVQRRSE
jgi:hypothetical protein